MTATTTLWELWSEIVQDSDSLADPVLLDIFSGGSSHRAFDNIPAEDLKSILSKIKSLLNEPKTREKGAAIFNELIQTVEEKRLVGLQDTLLTCLRLICNDKYLHSPVIQDALANFLPKCKNLPDVLKELTPKNAYISKIVASCIEELQVNTDATTKTRPNAKKQQTQSQPSAEVLRLLRICLTNFRGTCGNFREKLEKVLVPYLDHGNPELVRMICNTLPLLSQIGGGGSRGDNHSKDWQAMVQKLIKEAYDTLYLLYSDCTALDEENPFLTENPAATNVHPLLPLIEDKKIYVKVSKIKKRLENLLQAIGAYLRKSFPSHKPVPLRSLLKLISYLISVNPLELLASQKHASRKELLFLTALLPSVHSFAFKLLDGIVMCVGSNILPQAVAVEQLFSQQWRWMETNKNSFVDLKRSMYSSLNHWLNMTKGQISNPKTLKAWVDYFTHDIQLEKETVELKMLSNKSKNKLHGRAPSTSSRGTVSIIDGLNPNNAFLQKSSETCEISLDILSKLLPSVDPILHKNLYCTMVKTHVQVYQEGSFPGQYASVNCRIKLNESLMGLALNPNARSNISLGLVINLLKKASLDPVSLVATFCISSLSTLERLVHPSSQSLEFPLHTAEHGGSNVDRSSMVLNNLMKTPFQMNIEESETVQEQETEEIITVESSCQTEITPAEDEADGDDSEGEDNYTQAKSQTNGPTFSAIMAALENIKDEVGKLGSRGQQINSTFGQYHLPSSSTSSYNQPSHPPQTNHSGNNNKRTLIEADINNTVVSNGHTVVETSFETNTKKSKIQADDESVAVSRSESEALLEMLGDFVDEAQV